MIASPKPAALCVVNRRNMGAGPAVSRGRGGGGGGGTTSGSAHLGPGAYDTKCARDISVSPALESRPLSSMASGSTRCVDQGHA